jgi:D-serine deaminase-like pyridoxal phosphate-dependent protein
MNITQLKTPAFLVDLERVKRNAQSMIDRAKAHDVGLRPHVKTHKTAEIARLQVGEGPKSLTVSTLAEARFFKEAGFNDITYAFPVTPDKLEEAMELTRDLDCFNLLVDHHATVVALSAFGRTRGMRFSVFLKVDPGLHRAGVNPESPDSIMLAQMLHADEAIDFKGILTHGGQSYACKSREEILETAGHEREVMVRFAGILEDNGVPCPAVSAGSTPTAVLGDHWDGITELRPGNYVFFDKFQADVGTCAPDDCAATILATVASHYPDRNQMLIDAGALALSKDTGAVQFSSEITYGAVMENQDLKLVSLSQEHGLIEGRNPIPFDSHPIGSRVRIIPNHSCLAASLFSRYHIVEGVEVVDEWTPVRGW